MLKNTEGKEVDAFEQELEYSIANLEKRCADVPDDAYSEGQLSAYNYALAIYRRSSEDDVQSSRFVENNPRCAA